MKKLAFLSLFFVLFLAAPAFAQWQPPIGVPSPNFGINETVASVYGDPDYYTHYIDNTVPCNDSGNGTEAMPRCTLPTVGLFLNLSPGDVIVVADGTYIPISNDLIFEGGGTQAQPVFFRGKDPNNKPTIQGSVSFYRTGAEYIIFENIKVFSPSSVRIFLHPQIGFLPNNISIRHSEVTGKTSGGISGAGGVVNIGPSQDIVLYNNYIHHNGDMDTDFDEDIHGITVLAGASNIWVVDNDMSYNTGNGIQINSVNQIDSLHHVYVGRNRAHHNGQAGLWTKRAKDIIFSENIAWGARASDASSLGDGGGLQASPNRVWFLFNKVYDSEFGIRMAGSSGVDLIPPQFNEYFIGNEIYDIHPSKSLSISTNYGVLFTHDPYDDFSRGKGIQFFLAYAATKNIIGNTIYDAEGGIYCSYNAAYPLIMYNNLVSNVLGYDIYLNSGPNLRSVAEAYNNLFESPAEIHWGDGVNRDVTSFETTYSTRGANNVEGNAMLKNVPSFCIRPTRFEYFSSQGYVDEVGGKSTVTVAGEDFGALGVSPGDRIDLGSYNPTPGLGNKLPGCPDWGGLAITEESCTNLIIESVSGDTLTITRDFTLSPVSGNNFVVHYYPYSSNNEIYVHDSSGFSVGDIIVYDHDGVARTVTGIQTNVASDYLGSRDRITFSPALSGPVDPRASICNWKSNNNVDWDLSLASGSDAIDSGVLHSAYDTFFSLYGIDIKKDIEGRTRPLDGDGSSTAEWDIGAYEFDSGAGPVPCSTAQLLSHISQWKQGSTAMPFLISKIASWKAGAPCP